MVPGPFATEAVIPYPYITALGAPHPGRSQVRRIEVKLLRRGATAGRCSATEAFESERQRVLSGNESPERIPFPWPDGGKRTSGGD